MKQLLKAATLVWGTIGVTCWADSIKDVDPLHGYCAPAGAQCIDNGTNSPTNLNPPLNFGFTVSPGPATGSTLLLEVLEPNNEAHAPVPITGTFSGTAGLFSATPWTSGDLDAFLGISASPANPIGAFLPDVGATGFFVYQLSISPVSGVPLQGASNPNVNPLENITGNIPQGTYIVGFLNEGTASAPDWVATANSSAILEEDAPPATTPEPSSITLVGLGTLGMVAMLERLRNRRRPTA